MQQISKQLGLSLMETLIYISIISLIIASLFSFSLTVAANRNKAYAVQEVQANIRNIITTINQDMRAADDVNSPLEGQSSASLSLDMGANPNIVYSVVDNVLYRTEGVGDPVAISTNRVIISNVLFTNLAASGEKDNIRLTANINYTGDDSQDFAYSQSLQIAFSIKK